MIARGRHRRPIAPPVGRGLVDLVRGARAVVAAADRVQSASQRHHREPAARLLQRRAGRPRAPRFVVLVDGSQRARAESSAAVAADDEEAPVDDGSRRMVGRGGKRRASLPAVGGRIVDLHRGDGLAARAEAADHEDAPIDLRDGDLLARGRHRGECDPFSRAHDVDRRGRVGRPAETAGQDHHRQSEHGAHASHERTRSSRPASSSTGTPRRRASSALLPGASPTTT